MTAPSTAGKKPPMPPSYPHFTEFAERWLLPFITVRLAEANRENTYTWCSKWWAHRPVAVRIAHLHAAFEAQRRARTGNGFSTFVLSHVDAHVKTILDAANGPLHRCTRTVHVATPSLSFDPVPVGWFTSASQPAGAASGAAGTEGEQKGPPPRFAHYSDFVQEWLLPVTAVRIAGNNREGQYTWCRQWWAHHGVTVRFAGLHKVFEAARRAEDKTAMSSLFTRHIDPHLRHILDAANGPLHRCTPDQHIDTPGLPAAPIPAAWFGAPGAKTPIERLGFGPDFRALANGTVEGPGS
ncbi:DUF4913 domain-containing protein [Nocardia abscessus]|uniref:DUF4913 domain-containing protein n=1 Tax=Nocardia abscessus TaxID=120957 RepID=UPI0018947D76|nr:DUF4913 domain-containing protein [Nocardia abscessus]MBF6339759.1 DUF4913 domain-containing protein [Nocardia abscessus]